jgi:oligoendopeptidase F
MPHDLKSAKHWFKCFHELSCSISETHTLLELNISRNFKNQKATKKLSTFEEKFLSKVEECKNDLLEIYLKTSSQFGIYENKILKENLNYQKSLSNLEMQILRIEQTKIIRDYEYFVQKSQCEFEGNSFHSRWNFIQKNESFYQNTFDSLLQNRKKQAQASGLKNYTKVAFIELNRVSYGVKECQTFRNSILKKIVPLPRKSIFPWEENNENKTSVPLKNPAKGNINLLIDHTQKIMEKIHPSFGNLFYEMNQNGLMDLLPRKNKSPGAFCVTLHKSQKAFVFANLSATMKGATTLIHEFGHALHAHAFTNIQHVLLRQPGFEFCEFASIGLELLSNRYFHEFWNDPKDVEQAIQYQLSGMIDFWPFMAMMDEWQHEVYSSLDYFDAKERNNLWKTLSRKYKPHLDWSSCPAWEELGWLSRPHIFTSPFYYVDYGIAQLGALQLWLASKQNYENAVEKYMHGLSLGGQKSLPELFAACGLKFDFGEELMGNICEEISNCFV